MSALEDAQELTPAPTRDVALVAGVYVGAAVVSVVAAALTQARTDCPPALWLLAGTTAATCVVWIASAATRNASMYDAYWSVAPLAMGCALLVVSWATGGPGPQEGPDGSAAGGISTGGGLRGTLALLLLAVWAWRLTRNWLRSWGGLAHEDWRYVRIRSRTGVFWQPVNLLGIHLMPTFMTWAGTLPLVPVIFGAGRPLGLLDAAAAIVTMTGIWLEWRADEDLHAFRRRRRDASELLDEGIWGRCRHPNYLGEMLFWWGLAGFAIAADASNWPWAAGALAITLLFALVSIPLIETRLEARKPAYGAYRRRVPMLLPLGGIRD